VPPQVPHLGTSPAATGEELGGGDSVVDFGVGAGLGGGDSMVDFSGGAGLGGGDSVAGVELQSQPAGQPVEAGKHSEQDWSLRKHI